MVQAAWAWKQCCERRRKITWPTSPEEHPRRGVGLETRPTTSWHPSWIVCASASYTYLACFPPLPPAVPLPRYNEEGMLSQLEQLIRQRAANGLVYLSLDSTRRLGFHFPLEQDLLPSKNNGWHMWLVQGRKLSWKCPTLCRIRTGGSCPDRVFCPSTHWRTEYS